MEIVFYISVLIGTFLLMEGITWCTHKYVMHGFLWYLHKDHHQVEPGFFEKNVSFYVYSNIREPLISESDKNVGKSRIFNEFFPVISYNDRWTLFLVHVILYFFFIFI